MAASANDDSLHAFDFSTIDDMDPSLAGGHKAIYEREVPFELRVQQAADTPQEVGTLEAVKVKILVLGEDASPAAIRMELTSENDLFFNYTHTLDPEGFRQVQEAQKLMDHAVEQYYAVMLPEARPWSARDLMAKQLRGSSSEDSVEANAWSAAFPWHQQQHGSEGPQGEELPPEALSQVGMCTEHWGAGWC